MAFTPEDTRRSKLNENIIKQLYLVAYMQGSKLPTCLGTNYKCSKVQVRGDGCTAIDTRSHVHETVLPVVVKTDHPIPICCSVYYFEVTINVKSRSGSLAVGVCSSRSSTNEWPGMEVTSYGYHSNGGAIYHNSKELSISAPSYKESDIIGCGVNFVTNSVFFTKNGVCIGPVSAGKKLPHPVYPCIAFACPNCHISANFGQHKFAFDIGQYIARERAVAISTAVDRKCNDQLAHITMRNLVAAYLLHNGFLEPAQALGKWVTKAKTSQSESSTPVLLKNGFKTNSLENLDPNGIRSDSNKSNHNKLPLGHLNGYHSNGQDKDQIPLSNGLEHDLKHPTIPNGFGQSDLDQSPSSLNSPSDETRDNGLDSLFSWPEAAELLLKRRQLRDTIRTGDYVSALCQLETYFKSLWEKDPSIAFVLWCHHFIDMIARQYSKKSHDDPCSQSFVPTPHNLETVHSCSPAQCSYSNENLRFSQKRIKPSSSLESSPEGYDTSHSNHQRPTNGIYTNPDDLTSDCILPTTNHKSHEHSPTTCQAPVRLRLETTNPNGSTNDLSLSSTQLPIYPPNCMCYRDNRTRSTEIVDSSDNKQLSNGSSNCNGIYPRAHSFCETGKHERRFPQAMRRASFSSMDLDSGSVGVEAAVGLVDPTNHTNWNVGNGLTRSKCLTVIRRGGRSQAPHTHSLSPNPVRTSTLRVNCSLVEPKSLSNTNNPANCNFHLPQSLLTGKPSLSNGDTDGNAVTNTTTTTTTTPTALTQNNNHHHHQYHHRASNPSLTTSPPIKSDPIYDLLVNGFGNNGPIPKENGLTSNLYCCCCCQNPSEQSQSGSGALFDLIKFGRSLRSSALDLQRQGVITTEQLLLLTSAFSLIAYQDPYKSPMSGLLHPRHRELLADAVNDAVLAHLKQPSRPVLDTALNYLERALVGDTAPALTAQMNSVPVYRFHSSSVGNDSPDSICGQRSHFESQDLRNQFGESLPVSSRDVLSPVNRTSSSAVNSPRDAEIQSLIADIQSRPIRSNDNDENPTNGSTGLLRPASTSVVSSSIYVPPSALLSLGSHSSALTRTSSIQRSSSQRGRPTSLQNLLHHRRQSQSSGEQHNQQQQHIGSSPSTITPSSRTANAASQWPIPSPASTVTTTTTVQPRIQSPSSRLTVASLTNTHTPTGPELAGFYHPILFID